MNRIKSHIEILCGLVPENDSFKGRFDERLAELSSLIANEPDAGLLFEALKLDFDQLHLPPDIVVQILDRILALGHKTPEILRRYLWYLQVYGGTNWRPEWESECRALEAEAAALEQTRP